MLRLFYCSVIVVLVGAIGAGASTAHSAAGLTAARQMTVSRVTGDSVSGWVFVAGDARVEHAQIRVVTFGGRDLTLRSGVSGKNGTFVVRTRALPARFVVESIGGVVDGLPLPITMRSVVLRPENHDLQYIDPATSVAARYALDHPKLPYGEVLQRVKHHLSLSPGSTLGESLRRSAREFDGRQFLSDALHSASGWDKYVRDLSREIDSHPEKTRSYATTRQIEAPQDGEEDGGIPLAGLGTTIAQKVGKEEVGQLMNQFGLGGLADTLGITDSTSNNLSSIITQLGTISSTLDTISTDIGDLQTGIANLQSAVTNAEYTSIEDSINTALPGVVDLGSPSDRLLKDLTFLSDQSSDVANDLQDLENKTGATITDGSSWCASNGPAAANSDPMSTISEEFDDCSTITTDLGTGGPPPGTPDIKSWCNQNQSTLGSQSSLASHACDLLTRDTYASGAVNAADVLYDFLVPSTCATVTANPACAGSSTGSDGLLRAYNKKLYADVVAEGLPLLGYANFSQPLDSIASQWEGTISILGAYEAAYDSVEHAGMDSCTYGSTTKTESNAQCDIDTANYYAQSAIPAAIPADIPQNETADTRTNLLWQQISVFACPGQDANLFFYGCQNDAFGPTPLATAAQLTTFLQGWQKWTPPTPQPAPNAPASAPPPVAPAVTLTNWLAAGGLPNFSYLGSVSPPAGFGPNGWAGTELSAIAVPSCHLVTDKVTGTYNLVTSTGLGGDYWTANTMAGYFCTVVRMTDNVSMSECVADFPGDIFNDLGCDATYYLTNGQEASTPTGDSYQSGNGSQVPDGPTSYDPASANYGNHVDYGHGNLLFLVTPVATNQYWWSGT